MSFPHIACLRVGAGLLTAALACAPAMAQQDAASQEGDGALDVDRTFSPPILASGGELGVYFPVANIIASVTSAPIEVVPTSGSTENLVRLRIDEVQLAIAQSDRVAQSVIGLPPFNDAAPNDDLRAVMVLFAEPITILVRDQSAIETIADLSGMRVNFGERDDLTGRLLHQVLDAYGISDDQIDQTAVPVTEQGDFLCADRVDAIAIVAAHPSGSVNRIAEQCAVRAIAIDGQPADDLMADIPALAPARVPGGLYPGIDQPVTTLGPVAILVAEQNTNPTLIADIVTSVIENLDQVRASHPALSDLSLESMRGFGLMAPLHDRAAAAYSAIAPTQ